MWLQILHRGAVRNQSLQRMQRLVSLLPTSGLGQTVDKCVDGVNEGAWRGDGNDLDAEAAAVEAAGEGKLLSVSTRAPGLCTKLLAAK